jgi:hypothetical protein
LQQIKDKIDGRRRGWAFFRTLEGLTNSKLSSLSQELLDLKDIASQLETSAKKQSSSSSSDTENDAVEETFIPETKAVESDRDIEDNGPSPEELLNKLKLKTLTHLSTTLNT